MRENARWELAVADPAQVQVLAVALRNLPQLPFNRGITDARPAPADAAARTLARLLIHRGLTEAEAAARFLTPSLEHLHSPEKMAGLRCAVDRLDAAIERKDPILIYGDYDVDGTMAVIILKTAIELCGGTADFHVPHRIREGYDMRDDVIERAAAAGIRLIISVDMGIRAFAPAETAHRLGVDLIVTDHHLPGPDGVPKAHAVVNPNQSGCEYPYKQLCGAGVAFKVAQGLMQRHLPEKDQTRMLLSFMKVVAIATIADAVPLTGENRVFASLGLDALRRAVNPGLRALLEVAQISTRRPPNSTEVAFRIAPRINAAGRMDVARDVIELFSVKDPDRARLLAGKLDRLNAERQEEERRILLSIEERIANDPALCEAYCIVVDGEGWHRGVIGIAATRIVERYHRPAIVISSSGEEAFGSGRSIRPFHLLEAVESSHSLFTRYGGHSHACGFAMPSANVAQLRAELDAFARTRLTAADFDPVLDVEAELDLSEVTPALFQTLSSARTVRNRKSRARIHRPQRPVARSAKNPERQTHQAEIESRRKRIRSARTFRDRDPDNPALPSRRRRNSPQRKSGGRTQELRTENRQLRPVFDALGWNMADRLQQSPLLAGDAIDIAFTIGHNDHPDFGGLELTLRDFKSESANLRRNQKESDLRHPA